MQGALLGVTTSNDFASFYLFWELMTFTSYLLVIHEQTQKALKAGFKYFIMCTSGAYIMLFAILTLHAKLGSFDFNIISQNLHLLSPTLLFSLLIMFIIGFGVKAGLVPMHSWLPDAHPVAPSSISAPMSGILTKAGIYGLVLVVSLVFGNELVESLGVTAGFSTIGLIISFLGAITLLYGEFMALVQKDIKRMLAYSTMAQIGEIVITLGVGTYLSLVGSLYHVLNHAIMKNLLFLAVGALIYRLKSQDIEKFKGIGTQMPITSLFFGIGILAIMGLPPFNGFISKFLMLYANVQAGHTELAALILFGSVIGGFYYVKLLRIIFFEKYEGPELKEAPLSMLIPLGVLTSLIITNGLYPQAGLSLVMPAVDYIASNTTLAVASLPDLSINWPLLLIVPTIGAMLTFILGKKSPKIAGISAVTTMVLTLAIIIKDFGSYDLFSASFAFLIAFVGVLNFIYSLGYMDHHGHAQNRFYMFFILMIVGLLGVSISDNLFSFFFFWEIMSSWTLYFVIIHEQTQKALKEGFKYFTFNYIGASLMFLGIVIISAKTGVFKMSLLPSALDTLSSFDLTLGLGLILVGLAMKAAMLPFRIDYQMHPEAAPTPVSGYISSVLLKSAPFGMAKLFFVFGGITLLGKLGLSADLPTIMYILAWISGITIFVAASLALLQSSMKLLLIYHTVSQMGYIILGISLGSSLGVAGGLLHLVNHMIFKDLLFLVAGVIMVKTGITTLDKLGGIGKKMPITLGVFAIGALSIAGIPPFNGFTSKWIIYQASMEQGYVVLAFLSLIASVLTLASFMKFLHAAFFGQLSSDLENVKEAPWTMLTPMLLLASACVIFGIFPGLLLGVIAQIQSLFGLVPVSVSLFGIDSEIGAWNAGIIGLLILLSLIIGAGVYFIGNRNIRYTKIYTCGILDLKPEEIHINSHNLYEAPKKLIKQGITNLKRIITLGRGVN
jgi:formate hydrogenlyase subunit 3/multisubunit Na+/H+ antiporter MnhD subunit